MSAPTDKPTVSLVISVWNRKDDLRENLASIRKQTVPADQVIVVDNDSSDGTPEMVIAEFPEVQLIRMPHSDYGACETFNVGFSSAKGDLVGILDDDGGEHGWAWAMLTAPVGRRIQKRTRYFSGGSKSGCLQTCRCLRQYGRLKTALTVALKQTQ